MRVPPELPIGKLPADQIVPALPTGVWFNAVGAPLDASERSHCEQYLSGLGLTRWRIVIVPTWEAALQRAGRAHWSAHWWDRERQEERRLYEQASKEQSADTLLLRLANLMQGSSTLFHPPASIACALAGVADESAAGTAAGAAAQCLHQYGLASITGQGDEHFFSAKFRLFLAGHWPLCVNGEDFFVF
jgi:hypothetical protein